MRTHEFFVHWFRLVRNSAITRWNASGSFASCALLETRISLWVAKKGETPQLANNWKSITRFLDNLSYQDCHLLQQQFVCNIEIKGSVKLLQKIGTIIRSSPDSKWQACMRETDADRSWQAGHGKPWTSRRKKKTDEMYQEDPTQGIPDWLQPFTVNLEDLEMHVLAHSCERVNSDSEGDASKVELRKTGAQYSYSLPQIPKEIYHTNRRDWWLENSRAQQRISEQSPVRCRGIRSHNSVDTTRVKPELHRRRRRIYESF